VLRVISLKFRRCAGDDYVICVTGYFSLHPTGCATCFTANESGSASLTQVLIGPLAIEPTVSHVFGALSLKYGPRIGTLPTSRPTLSNKFCGICPRNVYRNAADGYFGQLKGYLGVLMGNAGMESDRRNGGGDIGKGVRSLPAGGNNQLLVNPWVYGARYAE
jgi:hypothetical protein